MAISFLGRSNEMFGIFIVNLPLTVATLGFYRFWGKTRMRRYLWSHFDVGGERLEYSGTGKELFVGFLFVVFAVLTPLFGGLGIWRTYLEFSAPDYVFLPDTIQAIAVAYLIPVGIFRARRYRLSRTRWRGIRGGQSGSAWVYGGMSLAYYLLAVLSLGLAWPVLSTRLTTYKMKNTWFGDRRVAFEARAGALYGTFLKVCGVYFLLAILAIAGIGFYGYVAETTIEVIGAMPAAGQDGGIWGLSAWHGLLLLGLPALYFIVRIPWYWYRAAEIRYFAGQTRYESLRFSSDVTGSRLTRLLLGNLLITMATLGLGLPIAYRRTGTFVAQRFRIDGKQDMAVVLQNVGERPKFGEGLDDAFDMGEF